MDKSRVEESRVEESRVVISGVRVVWCEGGWVRDCMRKYVRK